MDLCCLPLSGLRDCGFGSRKNNMLFLAVDDLNTQPVDGVSIRPPTGSAALAAKKNTTPLHVPLQEIKELLKAHGAIVPAG